MFRRKTLFILGAGASQEAWLPVGTALANNISSLLEMNNPAGQPDPQHPGRKLLWQLYQKFPLHGDGYDHAAKLISGGVRLAKSIDDFLDRHNDKEPVQRVGKAAIVKSILDAEAQSLFGTYPFNSDNMFQELENKWYSKFFRMLGSDIRAQNVNQIFDNVDFIVFNYDRCLEYFIENALQLVYNIARDEAQGIVDDLNIIHPYGLIADLPRMERGVPFGAKSADYVALSDNVKIYTELSANGDVMQAIAEAMFKAQQIAFLGFGYHEQNLDLLTPGDPLPSKPVYGTATGWSDNDREEIRGRLERMFQYPPPRLNPKSAVVIDTKVTCAGLFDSYGQSLTGR
jgi:hypothetical protein